MKKSIILSILFLTILNNTLFAKFVSQDKAQQVALHWLKHINSSNYIFKSDNISYNSKNIGYLFLLKPKGFILVPSNDILPPIKLYSLKTNFYDFTDYFREFIKKEIFSIIYQSGFSKNNFEIDNSIEWANLLNNTGYFADVETEGPLLTTTWDQTYSYNAKYPGCSDCDNSTLGHYYAGCVMIATAQMMKYFSWPITGRGYHSYIEPNNDIVRVAYFYDRHYNWDLMPDSIEGYSNDSPEVDELTLLLYDLSVAMEAELTKDGTSAYFYKTVDALYKFFKYQPPQYIFRANYGLDSEWFDVFKEEIKKKQPALLGIYKAKGEAGHAVVVDGYQISGDSKMLHLNMGWGGSYNGWYTVNNIKEYVDEMQQEAIIGINIDNETDMLYYYDEVVSSEGITIIDYDNIDKTAYLSVQFSPEQCGEVSHIAFYIAKPDEDFTVYLYKGNDNISYSTSTSPLLKISGSSNKNTGWNYVMPDNPINLDPSQKYYVVLKLFDKNGGAFVPAVKDDKVSGKSYIGNSIDNLTQITDYDYLIRLGAKNSFECSSSGTDSDISTTAASPSTNITPIIYSDGGYIPNPSDNQIFIKSEKNIFIQPKMAVPEDVQGKKAILKIFIYLPDYNQWGSFPDKEVTLGSEVKFDNIATSFDFSNLQGLKFQVWFGFYVDSTLYFNNYEVIVQ